MSELAMRARELTESAVWSLIRDPSWNGVVPYEAGEPQAMEVRQLRRPVRFGGCTPAKGQRIDLWRYRDAWYAVSENATPTGVLAAIQQEARSGAPPAYDAPSLLTPGAASGSQPGAPRPVASAQPAPEPIDMTTTWLVGFIVGAALVVGGFLADSSEPHRWPSASEAIRQLPGIPPEIIRAHTQDRDCARVYSTDCSGAILFPLSSGWKGRIEFPADLASIGFAPEEDSGDKPVGLWDGSRPQLAIREPSPVQAVAARTHDDAWGDEIVGGTGQNVSFTPWIAAELAPVSSRTQRGDQDRAGREVKRRQAMTAYARVTVSYPFSVDDEDFLERGRFENRSRSLERAVEFFGIMPREADVLDGTPAKEGSWLIAVLLIPGILLLGFCGLGLLFGRNV